MLDNPDTSINGLLNHYRLGDFTPREFLTQQLKKIHSFKENPAWITPLSLEQLEEYLQPLYDQDPAKLPLYGIPFAIKDNIDLAGVPTTAACPDFAHTPKHSATVVQNLIDAGAIPLGKTNLDQFATGLVGTRSPYGVCHSVFSKAHISGGSSAGSAVAVAEGLVAFALGTDTAGSGRIPAAFNNLVGLKPSRGLLSNQGMLRACRSLDCISIFALTAVDAQLVFDLVCRADPQDEYSRPLVSPPLAIRDHPKVAIPLEGQLEFFGDSVAQAAHADSVKKLEALGWEMKPMDFSPLFDTAALLYQGPWVAEREAAFGEFAHQHPKSVLSLIHQILEPAKHFSAEQVFQFQYQLQKFKRQAEALLSRVDFALTPTAPTHYRIDQVLADPIALNSNLGTYTNYMNLLDLSAIAVPTGFTEAGLPFGVTLFAPAFHDYQLLGYADRVQRQLPLPLGKTGRAKLADRIPASSSKGPDRIELAVCGAHMSGLALNGQLLERDGVLLQKTRTAASYQLFALKGGPPYRPGLVRNAYVTSAIELEVWSLPVTAIGSLLELIPAPLGLGKVELQNGRWVSSFICEPWGINDAEDISSLGSWRGYLGRQNS
jgi:allophanate hydrolase